MPLKPGSCLLARLCARRAGRARSSRPHCSGSAAAALPTRPRGRGRLAPAPQSEQPASARSVRSGRAGPSLTGARPSQHLDRGLVLLGTVRQQLSVEPQTQTKVFQEGVSQHRGPREPARASRVWVPHLEPESARHGGRVPRGCTPRWADAGPRFPRSPWRRHALCCPGESGPSAARALTAAAVPTSPSSRSERSAGARARARVWSRWLASLSL